MNKNEFKELLSKHRIFLDGATGSNLIKRGNMPSGVCPEKWILENKEVLIGLQEDYFKAGSNIVYAPTFTANRIKLAEYGLENDIDRMNQELVELSREAVRRIEASDSIYAKNPHLIAGDLTMTGKQLKPMGPMEVEELIDVYKQQIQILIDAGVDLLVIETMMSLQECRCAVIAAKEVCEDIPVMVTMTFEESGRALYGTDPVTALLTLQALGADAFGINCGTGPDKLIGFFEELNKYAKIPLICKPNAGLPQLLGDGSTTYSMSEQEFAESMKTILSMGISLLGGCCGTSPEYIDAVVKLSKDYAYTPAFLNPNNDYFALTSERQSCIFDLDSPFIIVGERINPTGKKALQAQLRDNNFEIVRDFATQQEEHGAQILDVNMGMSGIDEKAVMLKALEEVTQVSNLPLSIDTSDPEVMEAGLRHYPGRALVNSVSLEQVKIEKMLPLVKKYGAMMILLPLSDAGLPENIEDKTRILHEILDKAKEIGLTDNDIIVDGLVATVGANPNAALETLQTIKYCREELHLPTTCGLSNISFGLPERSFVNASFLTMAIMSGLTMAISNPNQDLLANTAFASDLLRNKKDADIKYINQISNRIEELNEEGAFISLYGGKKIIPGTTDAEKSNAAIAGNKAISGIDAANNVSPEEKDLYKAVLKGNRNGIVELTKKCVQSGSDPHHILNNILLTAINLVGEYFDKGKYFLPQLIASAESMEKSIAYLEPMLKAGGEQKPKGTIVIATVQGDIHDIGKNLVALMLRNHGFKVIDLGKDVSKETIVDCALENKADIIALSALMTTTMKQMEEVINFAKEKGCTAKTMIGGAVITQEYAQEIGASGYSADAADAVKLAENLLAV